MAATRVFASRLATQMATKAARPAIRAPVAAASKRTITGKKTFSDLDPAPKRLANEPSRRQLKNPMADNHH